MATGILSASPPLPAEHADTIGLEWLLVAQSKLPSATVSDLARIVYENKEGILRGVVIGLRDGTVSSDGLDTLKLGYEFVSDEITLRRGHLKRHSAQDHAQGDEVVAVKTAQSA